MAPINLPDGSEVSEVVLPDGSTASEVIAPDGSTVFSAIPDSVVEQFDARSAFPNASDGDRPTKWAGELGTYTATGSGATVRDGAINGFRALEWTQTDESFSVDGGTFSDISQPFAVFAVVEPFFSNSVGDFRSIVHRAGSANNVVLQWDDADNWNAGAGSGLAGSNTVNRQLIAGLYDGSSSEIHEDGSSTSGDAGGKSIQSLSIGSFDEGAGDIWNGYIGFLEVHDGAPSNGFSTRKQEIADDWGIAL